MKQRIRRFLGDDNDLDDIWFFKQQNESYQRLDNDNEDPPIGSVLSDNDVIYLVEDRFFYDGGMFPVYYKDEEIGRVGWNVRREFNGYDAVYYCDTVLSLKLRIQELLGFPVSSIDVKFRGKLMKNHEMIDDYWWDNRIRIEVA